MREGSGLEDPDGALVAQGKASRVITLDAPAVVTLTMVPSIFEAVRVRMEPLSVSRETFDAARAQGASAPLCSGLLIADVPIHSQRDRDLYRRLRSRWAWIPATADRGAAATLLRATKQPSILLADESVTRVAARELRIPVLGSVELLIVGGREQWVDPKDAIAAYAEWKAQRGHLLGESYMSMRDFRRALNGKREAVSATA